MPKPQKNVRGFRRKILGKGAKVNVRPHRRIKRVKYNTGRG